MTHIITTHHRISTGSVRVFLHARHTVYLQACGVLGGPQLEAHAMEAGSFPGSRQGGQHQVSAARGWDSGLQRSQDSHGTDGWMDG